MYNESEVNHKHPSCFLYHFTLNSKSNHEYTVHAECVRKSNNNFLSFIFIWTKIIASLLVKFGSTHCGV